MDIKINGTPKEIAAFISALQRRNRGPVTLGLGIDGREMAKDTIDQLKILGARGRRLSEIGKECEKGTCCCQHNIRLKVDVLEIRKTEQPWSISVDGVEIPTYKALWLNQKALEREINWYKFLFSAQGVVILLALIAQLLT